MRRLLILLALLAPVSALAQSSPAPSGAPISQGFAWRWDQWQGAFKSKLDWNNGIGFSVTTPNNACTTNGSNGTTLLINSAMCIQSHFSGTLGNGGQNFMAVFDMEANNNNEEPVALYSHMKMDAGATGGWAGNDVLDVAAGVVAGALNKGGIGREIDVNNWNCTENTILSPVSTGACPQTIGLLMIGSSPYTSSRAMQITGVSAITPQWQQGIIATGNSIAINLMADYSASNTSYAINGSHTLGIDCAGGSFSSACIRVGDYQKIHFDTAGLHGIFWDATNGTFDITGGTGAASLLQINGTNGGLFPTAIAGGASVGTTTNPFNNVYSAIFDVGQPSGIYASLSADISGNLLISALSLALPSAGLSGTASTYACFTAASGGNVKLVSSASPC